MFIPAIIGITINAVHYRSVKVVFAPIISSVKLKSVLFAILYPILFLALQAVLILGLNLGHLDESKLGNLGMFPPLLSLPLAFLAMFGEEYGWRGFLLKELTATKGKTVASIVVGIVWALWHAPLIYQLGCTTKMEHPFLLMLVQMGAVFVASIPFAYSYYLTDNIIPPMIYHFTWNLYNPIVFGNIYRNKPGIIDGNMIITNGEGLAGFLLGLLCMFVFIFLFKRKQVKIS